MGSAAFPGGDAGLPGPRFLIRDNDDKNQPKFEAVTKACDTKVNRTAVKDPLMNSICERCLGPVKRKCLDHILLLGEDHLRRVLREHVRYFVELRPHQELEQHTPTQMSRGEELGNEVFDATGQVESIPVLRGLHHDYRRAT